jgi:V8-like Glu-specific endopeptidase
MKHQLKYASVLGLLVVISLIFSSGVQARSTPVADNSTADLQQGAVVAKVISRAQQQAALARWDHAALAAAQPMAMPVDTGDATALADGRSAAESAGTLGFSAPGFAAPGAEKVAQRAYAEDWAALDESALAAGEDGIPTGTSQVYTSYIINQMLALQKVYPHKWVGRLSFTVPGGTSFCSATAISGNVMLTAAHCVFDTPSRNSFYSNWVFTPAYRNGNAPYGSFPATTCWVLTTWVNLGGAYNINTWAPHDVAVCKMGKNSAGQTLNAAVGWMGRQWNAPYVRHFHNMGYPFNDFNNAPLPNAGRFLRTCVAESFQQAARVRGMGCNLGPGISGGPWMIAYAVNVVSGFADGVNSGLFIGVQNIYGARFDSNNIVVLCNAAVC